MWYRCVIAILSAGILLKGGKFNDMADFNISWEDLTYDNFIVMAF